MVIIARDLKLRIGHVLGAILITRLTSSSAISQPGARNASFSAARARSRVESRRGTSVSSGLRIRGISVHAITTASQPRPAKSATDSQSIAIGIENNNVVGPDRTGPRNQRRTPVILNNVFYPALMWNSRFHSISGDPFDNSAGFQFPLPEGFSLSNLSHLLEAQAFIPTTEKPEMTGFHPSVPGTNDGIRAAVVDRLNANADYRKLFGKIFTEVKAGAPITYEMLARAIAEFEFTLLFADAPIDKFARGLENAMTEDEKRGAVLFFGSANCVSCHAVAGQSNEMFSDFRQHVAGIPQIAPAAGNVTFDGPGANEDFGLEQVTGNPNDRYAFRTSPLRNLALQPAFFHNGSFTRLEDALRYHLDAVGSAPSYNAVAAGVDIDLQGPQGPIAAGTCAY